MTGQRSQKKLVLKYAYGQRTNATSQRETYTLYIFEIEMFAVEQFCAELNLDRKPQKRYMAIYSDSTAFIRAQLLSL